MVPFRWPVILLYNLRSNERAAIACEPNNWGYIKQISHLMFSTRKHLLEWTFYEIVKQAGNGYL
jgi:hypothetical protein